MKLPTKTQLIQYSGLAIASIVIFEPSLPLYTLQVIAEYRQGITFKVGLVYLLIFHRKTLIREIKRIFYRNHKNTIQGIPIDGLVAHLLSTERFTREEAKTKWGIAHHKYCDLAKHLEQIGVLVRGEKNARVLNLLLSPEQIAERVQTGERLEHRDDGLSESPARPVFSVRSLS